MTKSARLEILWRRSTWRGATLGLICAMISWLLTLLPFVRGLDEWVLDSHFSLRGPRASDARVVIIGLEERSLDDLNKPLIYSSPELAEAVRHAHGCGAAAIGIDVILPENAIHMSAIVESEGEGSAREMGFAVAEAGNVVLAEWHLGSGTRSPFPQWTFPKALDPEPIDVGFVNFTGDADSFVRKQQLILPPDETDEGARPSFALALVARAEGGFEWRPGGGLFLGDAPVPMDDSHMTRINYVGAPGTLPLIPLREILADARAGRETPALAGAVVIVGVTAEDWQDYHPMPYSNLYFRDDAVARGGLMSGPEIQGHIVAMLLDRAFIREFLWLQPIALVLTGLVMGMAAMRLTLRADLACTLLFLAGWYAIGAYLFVALGWHLPFVGMAMLAGLTCFAGFLRRGLILRNILNAVKSAPIARALESSGNPDLSGESREVSVLFADVRSFTTFSERFSEAPQRVVSLLNAYFTAIVPEIERHGGTLNQYMGDGIMVLFGAPDRQEDHAYRAVLAAKAIARVVAERPDEWAKHGYEGMKIGVGISTGPALIGAIGSPRRLDYTAIGDTTNTAARIESKTKEVGSTILIGEGTMSRLTPAQRRALRLDGVTPVEVELKGKAGTLRVYPVPTDDAVPDDGSASVS